MRLTDHEVRAIKTAACEAFGDTAKVRLFGSRVHDNRRGGDIDLLIEVDDDHDEWRRRGVFQDRFFAMTEPRKVDVLLGVRGRPSTPFEDIARRDGVIL